MSGSAAPSPSGAYLRSIAREHVEARGFHFDPSGDREFEIATDRAIETAHESNLYTVQDLAMNVVPNTIRLADGAIENAEDSRLTAFSVRQALKSLCPIFPFC
jgi:hypothetical protein